MRVDQHDPRALQHQVFGTDVSVRQAVPVERGQGGPELFNDLEHLAQWKPPPLPQEVGE